MSRLARLRRLASRASEAAASTARAASERRSLLIVSAASGVLAWALVRNTAVVLAVTAGVAAGAEWVIMAALAVWVATSIVFGRGLSAVELAVALAAGLTLAAAARLASSRGSLRPGFSAGIVAFLAVASAIAGSALAFGVQLYMYLLSRIDDLPLSMYEALAPLKGTLAGRLAASTLALAASAYSALRVIDSLLAFAAGREPAGRLAVLEAREEAAQVAEGRDYSTRILGEALVGVAALVYAPVARYLVDHLSGQVPVEALPHLEPLRALAPLAYYAVAWLALRSVVRSLLNPVEKPPRVIAAVAPVAAVTALVVLLSALDSRVASEALAAIGLGEGRPGLVLDENAFNREYLDFIRSIVSIIEFAVKFFWSG